MNIKSVQLIQKITSHPDQFGLFCETVTLTGLDSFLASCNFDYDTIYLKTKIEFKSLVKTAVADEKAITKSYPSARWRYTWKWSFRFRLVSDVIGLILKVHDVLSYLELFRILAIPWENREPKSVHEACTLLIQLGFLYERYRQLPESELLIDSYDILHQTSYLHSIITKSWNTIQEYVVGRKMEWFRLTDTSNWKELSIDAYLKEVGLNEKALYLDQDGCFWLCKYDAECLINPALVSLIQTIANCPGSEEIRVYLSYDLRRKRLCSVQRFIDGSKFQKLESIEPDFYSEFINNSKSRAVQIVCQATTEWLVGNINGFQTITTKKGNIIFIDQDRSFFYSNDSNLREKIYDAILVATLRIDGVKDLLLDYVDRIASIPGDLYESVLHCASPEVNRLTTIFLEYWVYQDTFQNEFDKLTSQWKQLSDRKTHLRYLINKKIKHLCCQKLLLDQEQN